MDKRYQALIQRRTELERERSAAIDEYEGVLSAAGEELTNEERTKANELMATVEGIDAELDTVLSDIRLEEKARDIRRQKALNREFDNEPVNISGVRDRSEDDGRHGFADVGEFALAVIAASRSGGVVDERLHLGAAPTNYHQETGGGAGEGFMVPPEFRDGIWEFVFETDVVDLINLIEHLPTNRNVVNMNANEATPWGTTGVQSYWRSEAGQMTPTKTDTDGRQNRLYELYSFVSATEEDLQDTPMLRTRITRDAGRAIKYKASDSYMRGTGAGQPLGWLNAGPLVTVAKEGSQAADTVVAANVAKMYSRVINPSRGIWLINPDVFPQLLTMTLGDNSIYVPPASGFQNAPGGFLMGRPVLSNEHCSTVGDLGDIQFVNLDGYMAIRRTAAPEFASSIHLWFDYGVQAFRWTFRIGGMPYASAAITPDNGSNTRSHFVTLAARA